MHHFTRQPHIDHPLARIDPRLKLFCACLLLVMVISCGSVGFPLAVAAVCGGATLAAGVSPKRFAVRFAEPLFIAAVVLLLKLLFSGHTPLWSCRLPWFTLTVHREGLLEGAVIASRILGTVSLVALLGFTTTFTELMAALSWFRCPKGFVDVALFAWRYLFVLFDDAMVVYHAQRNRLGYAGIRRGLRSFGALSGALVIKAFDNSQNITTAMVQRGYDGDLPLLSHRPLKGREVLASAALLACAGMLRVL